MKTAYSISWLICMLFVMPVMASTWNPVVLVNTEAFQTIDEGDSTTNVILRFGDTLDKTITFDRGSSRFDFNDDIFVAGSITATGTVSGTTLVSSGIPQCDLLYTNAIGEISCGSSPSLTGANLATIQVRRDTSFTMPALSTFYDVPFNNTDTASNTGVLEHNAINTERIDVKQSGFYLVSYHVNANDAAVTHQLDARVGINNISVLTGSLTVGRNYQNEYSPNVSTNVAFLQANDYVTLQVSRSTANTVINETVLMVTKLNGIQGEKGDKGDSGDLTVVGADALFVRQSGDTMTGSLTLANNSGVFAAGNLTLNSDNDPVDAILTFGNDLGVETLRFSDITNLFEFSDGLVVNGNLATNGTMSGNNLVVSSISDCIRMGTDSSGQAECKAFRETATINTVDNVAGGTNTIVGIDIPVLANANYMIECQFTTSAAATTTGVQFTVNGPAAPTELSRNRKSCSSTTGLINSSINTFGTEDVRTGSAGVNRCIEDHTIHLRNGANAGNVTFSLDTEIGGSAVTSHAGSYCTWRTY